MKCYACGLLCLLAIGCTNRPGALEMSVSPVNAEVRPNEPIRLDVTLTAAGGNICLAQSRRYLVELCAVDGATLLVRNPEHLFICGTGYMLLWPLHPVFVTVAVLDVADSLDRFEVLRHHHKLQTRICIEQTTADDKSEKLCVLQGEDQSREPLSVPWHPGEYVVRVRLSNEHSGFLPPPLFWWPYNQSVSAETCIHIAVE